MNKTPYPLFLSAVLVVHDQRAELRRYLESLTAIVAEVVTDYEIVIVDNGSTDDTLAELERLTGPDGLPNIQVFSLIKRVDRDTAAWAGIEGALGDFVAAVDPTIDDFEFLPTMIAAAARGADVVFARNENRPPRTLTYAAAFALFNACYKWLSGVHLAKDAPDYRLLSRRVVNLILQHPQPAITYRHLPASGGFSRVNLSYRSRGVTAKRRRLRDSIDRGLFLLVSTTRAPMRLVTGLSFFGAIANVLYSLYVIGIAAFKQDVEPGWVTLSLQQSGMFFLFSVVLLVLGEYILHMANVSNEGPPYHVGRELTSVHMRHRERPNVAMIPGSPRG